MFTVKSTPLMMLQSESTLLVGHCLQCLTEQIYFTFEVHLLAKYDKNADKMWDSKFKITL